MRLAGLSIEGARVRVAVVNRLPGRSNLISTSEHELPEGEEQRAQGLRAILGTLKEQSGVQGVVVGLGITAFTHHYMDLPLTKKQDIIHALAFELEKYLPLPPDEYLYDFATISRSPEGSRIMVLAALKSRLSWIWRTVEEAGMTLVAIRCGPMEALNEFSAGHDADGISFVYEGHDATSVFGLASNMPAALNILRSGTHHTPEINAIKKEYPKGSYSVSEPGAAVAVDIGSRPLDYSLPSILAHSAFRKRRLDLLFLPPSQRRATPFWHEYAPIAMGVLCVLLLVMTSALSYLKDASALRRINAEIEKLEPVTEELMEVKREIMDIDSRRLHLQKLISERNRKILALRELSARLPRTAWLTSYSSDDKGKIEIQGYAVRASEIIRPLDNSDLFENVEFTSPVTISGGRERFSLKMDLVR